MKMIRRLSLEGDVVDLLEVSTPVSAEPTETDAEFEQELESAAGEHAESELVQSEAEDAADFDDEQTIGAVMESLHVYAAELEHLIATGTGTSTTADLITIGVEQQLARLQAKLPKAALESGTDITQRHQLVLEGVGSALKMAGDLYAQAFVLSAKETFNGFADIFNGKQSIVAKYGKKLEEAQSELNAKRAGFQSQHHDMNTQTLGNFFYNDKGISQDIAKDAAADVLVSEYILTKYPVQLLASVKKLVTIVKGRDVRTIKDLGELAAAVGALPHPASLFDKKYLKPGKPYLARMGLEVTRGTARSSVAGEGNQFAALSAMATPSVVVETGRFLSAGAGHAANSFDRAAKTNWVWPQVKYETKDIDTVIGAGKKYLDNVSVFLKLNDEIQKLCVEIEASGSKIFNKDAEFGANDRVANVVIAQVKQCIKNLLRAIRTPATAEISRSLKGAKYCQYAALRMIYKAK